MKQLYAERVRPDTCRTCRHFQNSPAFLEGNVAGLNSMSSAYADVRMDDGICLRHDVHLRATAHCQDHQATA